MGSGRRLQGRAGYHLRRSHAQEADPASPSLAGGQYRSDGLHVPSALQLLGVVEGALHSTAQCMAAVLHTHRSAANRAHCHQDLHLAQETGSTWPAD